MNLHGIIPMAIVMLFSGIASAENIPVYKNPQAPVEERVADLLSRMTLDEKTAQLRNNSTSDHEQQFDKGGSPDTPDGILTVEVDVTNTGSVPGKEVVQLYVNDNISFVSTQVQTRTFTLTLPMEELVIYDEAMQPVVEPGDFELMVGSASDDIRSRATFAVR